ncbi:MAG: hypothetical protein M1339_00635, partial [Bacteroidetes bacterium]|nr:hypothetical protein [Bacteroidota bacterium]
MARKRMDTASGRICSRSLSLGALIPAFVLMLGFLINVNSASAQIVSNGTGGGLWTSPGTWAGGIVPTSTDNVTIVGNDSVATNPTNVVSCANLTIQSGAILNVLGSGVQMTGDFSIASGARYINATDSAKAWPAGAHSYTIDPNSTFEVGPSGNSTLGWAKSDSLFGNVIIDHNLSGGVSCGANLTIQGNLTVNAGSGSYFRGISAGVWTDQGVTKLVHHVMGNVTVLSGNWSAVDMGTSATVPLTGIWNVDGSVTVGSPSASGARFSPITSADNAGAYGAFNIKGNLSFVNGGRLAAGSNSNSTQSPKQIALINVQGNVSFDRTATFAVNSMGNFVINFTGTKPQTVTMDTSVSFASGSTTCTLWDTVAAGANVTFTGGHFWRSNNLNAPNGPGAFVVKGVCNFDASDTLKGVQKFILEPGATLGIGSPGGIVALTDAAPDSGNIQADSARVFSSGANYVYNGTAAQKAGSGLPSTVNNLTINNKSGVTLASSDTVAGTFTITAGTLNMGSDTLYVSNNQPGAVVPGDTSAYVLGGFVRAQGTSAGSYAFPIGTASGYHGATMNFTTAPTAASNLTVAFAGADPTTAGLPSGVSGYWPSGYWTISSSGTPGGTYDLTLYGGGVPGIDTGGVVIMQKSKLADAWLLAGLGTNVSGNFATGKGISGLGVFGFGYGKITGVLSRVNGIPTTIALGNFPNPFNPT